MNTFNIEEISEQILQQLQSRGYKAMKNMRSVGFGMAIRYFRRLGTPPDTVTVPMLDSFMLAFRRMYESGEYSMHTWTQVQRSVGLVQHYVLTGEILDHRLPSWEVTHNPLRLEPSAEQLADNDNVWGLVWRARAELVRTGFQPRMCVRYGYCGFDKILRRHMRHETDRYNPGIVEEIVSEYRARFEGGEINNSTYSDLRKAGLMLDELHQTGRIAWKVASPWGQRQATPAFELCIAAYVESTTAAGNLAEGTIRGTKSCARMLVFELEDRGHSTFASVTLFIVSEVLTALSQRHTVGGIKGLFNHIRRFLCFLHHNGDTAIDLSIAVPECMVGHRSFGYGFSREGILAMLACANVDSDLGKRDFAMLTLAAQTGLRSIDIVNLKRGDIDWRAKEIRLVQQKTGKALSLPLEPESGNAIAEYLLTARPPCELPHIFITHTTPLRALGSCALQGRVKKHMRISGIKDPPGCGVHSFRRGFGTRLLESEVPIELLHQILGQTCMESAKPYIAVNDDGLKMCALGLVATREEGAHND
jgi:site-specific recombinase XerD